MKLAFYYSLACTAKCSHCITFAAPKVRRTMPLEKALAIVDAVSQVPDLDGIVFTGGENLIHREQLLELVRRCSSHQLSSEIITNAFWGRDRDTAVAMIEPFAAAGLTRCRVSIDRYHLPFVKPAAVHVALSALAEVGLERLVTCVVDRPNAVYKANGLGTEIDLHGLVPGQPPVESIERLTA
jgi:MoaA/NifB/PqqE/SkfB family radical SAM enzyme